MERLMALSRHTLMEFSGSEISKFFVIYLFSSRNFVLLGYSKEMV